MTNSAGRSKRETNLNIRVSPQQKRVIAHAAQLKQTTLSNFVLEQAYEAARNIVLEQRHFNLSPDQWQTFCEALEAAPREYPRLRKLLSEPSVFDRA